MTDLNEAQEPTVPLPSKRKLTTATAAVEGEIDTAKKLRPETTPAAAVEEKIINGEKTETENDDEDSEEYEAEDEINSDDAVSDDDDDSDGEEEENRNGKGKGKGIMKDDKGKGKMIEESDDDSDDSGDGGATDSDGDDDLSDDPLAEVDLDNILPSRTRGRSVANSGVRISSNDDDDKNDK